MEFNDGLARQIYLVGELRGVNLALYAPALARHGLLFHARNVRYVRHRVEPGAESSDAAELEPRADRLRNENFVDENPDRLVVTLRRVVGRIRGNDALYSRNRETERLVLLTGLGLLRICRVC